MSSGSDPDDSPQDLAGEYVLGTLDAAQRRDVEQRLVRDAPLRAAVDAWEARLLPLTALAPEQEAPATVWQRIEQRLAAASPSPSPSSSPESAERNDTRPAAGTAPRPPTPAKGTRHAPTPPAWHAWWNHLALWRGLAVAGMAAALFLSIRPGLAPPGDGAPQYVVVLVAPGGQAPGWVVQVSAPRDLSLIPLARTDMPADKALELWTKADDWAAPVSLGLVRPGEPLRLQLDKLPPLQPNQLFEITLEPPTGSPTGRPTGPIQFIGRAVKLST